MKIVVDENMALARELFGTFGDVVTAPGRAISPALVADADVLLVRSVTPVNSRLLAGSRVRFVGTATIGTDHLDLSWLASQAVTWASAPGCNAAAVADYVIAALSAVEPDWLTRRVGIVGCGNAGGGLYRRLAAMGVDTLCCDPFLGADSGLPLVDFDSILEADILCLHTPLTRQGSHPSWHLFDSKVLARLKPDTVLLNAGRGGVIDNQALLAAVAGGHLRAILDVWEGEPHIDTRLLDRVALGPPHIAGYSLDGRLRGSLMIYDALRQWLGEEGEPIAPESLSGLVGGEGNTRQTLASAAEASFVDSILSAYDPRRDFESLCAAVADTTAEEVGVAFDRLRKHYPWRREFGHFVLPAELPDTVRRRLLAAGFRAGEAQC